MRQVLLAGVFLLATVVGVKGPPAPIDFGHVFGYPGLVELGAQEEDFTAWATPAIPARLVRTTVIVPTDPPGEAAEAPAKAGAAAAPARAELATAMPRRGGRRP